MAYDMKVSIRLKGPSGEVEFCTEHDRQLSSTDTIDIALEKAISLYNHLGNQNDQSNA